MQIAPPFQKGDLSLENPHQACWGAKSGHLEGNNESVNQLLARTRSPVRPSIAHCNGVRTRDGWLRRRRGSTK